MLEGVLPVIQWENEQREALDRAEKIYTSLVTNSLGSTLGDLERTNPDLAKHILELLVSLDAGHLRRVVLAPESTCRLLWRHDGACDDRDFWRFFNDVLEVELLRARSGSHLGSPIEGSRWSALGDFRAGGIGAEPRIQAPVGGLVVDTESPAAVCFNPGMKYIGIGLQHYEDAALKELVLCKLQAAMDALDATSGTIAGFTRRFTMVANLVLGPDYGFSSGSTDEYVGRSILWNVHLESTDIGTLAEALVHEAIHSLLSMHETTESWFLSDEPLSSEDTVESPWTGARLRIEPFLQACFVWFGLAHFWEAARQSASFPEERMEAGLTRARSGFLKGRLCNRFSRYVPDLAPHLVELIGEMQERILSGTAQDGSAVLRFQAT